MAFGLSAGAVAAIGAVAGPVIGAMTADGASSVGQAGAAQASGITAAQYDETKRRISPYTTNGAGGSNKLAYLLGTGGAPGIGGGSLVDTSREIPGFNQQLYASNPKYRQAWDQVAARHQSEFGSGYSWNSDAASIDRDVRAAMGGDIGEDPLFGSLLKKYTGQDLLSDPGYEFRRSEGQKGVERSAAGRGGLFSGQAGKELERYNQGFASNEFQRGFDRDQSYKGQTYGMLSGQAAQGLNAEGVLANTGAGAAGRQAEYATQGANAEASGMVGAGNAINSGIGNYQNYNMLNSLFNKTVQGGGSSSAYDPVAGYGYGNLGSGS